VGERTLEIAQRLVHHVVQVLAPGCVPLLLTDGLKAYGLALLTHFGQWVSLPRQRPTGPAPKPRWMPRPELLYAQVVKTYRRRRLICLRQRVVFGTLAHITHVLAPPGWHINTAFVERINLTLRHPVAAVGRRVMTLCKRAAGLRDQLHLYHTYYNFCLPHVSLRVPMARPHPNERKWLGQTVAPVYTCHGRGADRSGVVITGSAPVSGSAVASAGGAVSQGEQ
jgi:hypothetical protein